MFTKFIFTCVILFACFTASYSQKNQATGDYSKKIGPAARSTYLDLLRLIFPDADEQGNAKTSIEIRNSIIGDDGSRSYRGSMQIESAELHWVSTAGGKRLMLIVRVTSEKDIGFTWGELNLMALYSAGPDPKLLDVVDASGDRQSSHWGNLRVNPKMDVIVFEYRHFNAGENFDGFSFTYVEKDKFKILFDGFPYLYYGRPCETELSETGAISMAGRSRNGFRDIVFTVKMSRQKFRDDCETPKSKKIVKHFRLTAGWKNGRYQFTDGGAEIKRLNRDEKRYGFGG
jgi:hypothetical protein